MTSERPGFGAGDYRDLPEWQAATRFASLVEAASDELDVPEDLEWLRYLIARSGGAVPPLIERAWARTHLAEYLLGLYESLDHVILLEYYLLFLRGEGYVSGSYANELDAKRAELERVILERCDELRAEWRETHTFTAGMEMTDEASLRAVGLAE
jgi:hypothetical protein